MHQEILFPREKAALYPLLAQQIAALAEDSQPLSTLANASALLYEALPDITTGRASTSPAAIRCILAHFKAGRPARRFRSAAAYAAQRRQRDRCRWCRMCSVFRGISPVTARPGRKLFCQFGWTGASSVCWTLIRQA